MVVKIYALVFFLLSQASLANEMEERNALERKRVAETRERFEADRYNTQKRIMEHMLMVEKEKLKFRQGKLLKDSEPKD